MAAEITVEIQAEASGHVAARPERVWPVVSALAQRANILSFDAIAGIWPEETARARVTMDKGGFEMTRTETVIRCVPQQRLVLKIEAPEWGSMAWLDHRIEQDDEGSRLTIAVIAVATYPEGKGPASREEYSRMTEQGLQDAVNIYRERIEAGAV